MSNLFHIKTKIDQSGTQLTRSVCKFYLEYQYIVKSASDKNIKLSAEWHLIQNHKVFKTISKKELNYKKSTPSLEIKLCGNAISNGLKESFYSIESVCDLSTAIVRIVVPASRLEVPVLSIMNTV